VLNQISASKDFGIELSDVTAYHPAATAQAPPAIQGLSLSIEPGEHVAVIGPSGSGKTSLLLVIAAALKVKSGKVSLNHQSVWELATRKLQELRGNLFFHRKPHHYLQGNALLLPYLQPNYQDNLSSQA
jgi:phosphonate transport system ATP-binding protein